MAIFVPRTFPQIAGEMVARLIAATPLTDVNYGSVFTTMLEAAAQEDDEQYFQMLEIIRGYSLDTTTGDDLDDRAFEYGLTREGAASATTVVDISDSAITKVQTGIYSGLSGPGSGTFTVNANDAVGFPPTLGNIIIGRGTTNAENATYTNITVFSNYVRFNLTGALGFDHGTDEVIVLAQGGDRLITAGTVVYVPESDINPRVEFSLDNNATILDGEEEIENVSVTASEAGSDANVPIGSIISFDSPPFSTAVVTNPARVTNGRDEETDQELRDRIKDHIQSLSKGTPTAIINGVVNVISEEENKRVVSAALVEPTTPAGVSKLYIDDGTGFIPNYASVGYEEVVPAATGGEKFIDIQNIPVMKAFVEAENVEPYPLSGGETLFVRVGSLIETVTFDSLDFNIPGVASAQEVLQKINSAAALFESRISSGGNTLRIFSRTDVDEQIQVTGGTANTALGFPTDSKYTTKLFVERNNEISLLSKDGTTAAKETFNASPYDMSGLFPKNFCIVVDGKIQTPINIWLPTTDYLVPATATAEEIANALNSRVPGLTIEESSNETRVTMFSNVERSSSSKVRVIENFDQCWNEEAAVLVDRTTEFQTAGSDVGIFTANLDYVYLGHADVPFNTAYVNLATPANADTLPTFEYWNGAAWFTFDVFDRTFGFVQTGHITFEKPFDWAKVSVNGSAAMYWIRIQRTNAAVGVTPIESRIRVCDANESLNFSEVEITGEDRDYTLNRFVGQIELETPLSAGDKATLGSYDTRAFAVTGVNGNFALSGGELFQVYVDGVLKGYTFQAGDFNLPGSATAAEVAVALEANIAGVSVVTVGGALKVKLISNTYTSGSLQVIGSPANALLQFPETLRLSTVSHVPALESIFAEPYVFATSDEVIFIIDENLANNYTVPCFYESTLTGAPDASTLVDVTLVTGIGNIFLLDTDLPGFSVELMTGAFAGERRVISTYVSATGTITTTAPFSGTPGVGDDFQVIPNDAQQVADLWNNGRVTLLSVNAAILASSAGTKVQVNSQAIGEDASVQVFGGTGNAILGFPLLITRGVDGYRYFTGLAQLAQWTVDGKYPYDEYPGIRAGGVQVEVIEPVIRPVTVDVTVVPLEGITLASILNDVKNVISTYINTLAVGQDVIRSELIATIKRDVDGVFDVTVNVPTDNIAIADSELARISDDDMTIG